MGTHKKDAKRLRRERRELLEWLNRRLAAYRKSCDAQADVSAETWRIWNAKSRALREVIERIEAKP